MFRRSVPFEDGVQVHHPLNGLAEVELVLPGYDLAEADEGAVRDFAAVPPEEEVLHGVRVCLRYLSAEGTRLFAYHLKAFSGGDFRVLFLALVAAQHLSKEADHPEAVGIGLLFEEMDAVDEVACLDCHHFKVALQRIAFRPERLVFRF